MRYEEQVWKAVTLGTAVLAGVVARNVTRRAWRRVRASEPPENPAFGGVRWRDAAAWALASGVAVGVARVLGRRAAAGGWRRLVGREPPKLA